MAQTKQDFNRTMQLVVLAAITTVIIACHFQLFTQTKKPAGLQPEITEMFADRPAQATSAATTTHPRPTATEKMIESSTQKPPTKEKPTALPSATPAKRGTLYDADFDGIRYSVIYPENFTHISTGEWEQFCLNSGDSLCVSIQIHRNGSWANAQALADETMAKIKKEVVNLEIYHQQSTMDADGFPAYWVGCYFTDQGIYYQSDKLFIVIQHIGFEIVTLGDPKMMESYQKTLKEIVESFRVGYN